MIQDLRFREHKYRKRNQKKRKITKKQKHIG